MAFTHLPPLMTFMIKRITVSKVNQMFFEDLVQPEVLSPAPAQNKALSVLPWWRSATVSSAHLFLASFIPAPCSWSELQLTEFNLVFLYCAGSDLTEQWPPEATFHAEWGLRRKAWRSGHYSSGDFKQCHLPTPRNPRSSQSLCKVFYSHIYLQNS